MQLVKVKRSGRPKAKPGTVRILADGSARLSYDLASTGDKFIPAWEKRGRNGYVIVLFDVKDKHEAMAEGIDVLTAYASRSAAASPMISLTGTIRATGLEVKDCVGEFQAKRRSQKIVIYLGKEIK